MSQAPNVADSAYPSGFRGTHTAALAPVRLMRALADRDQHRAPSMPDLIIAATAELAGLTVLHLDKDFDLIAVITGQPMERLNVSPPAAMDSDASQAEA